MKTKINRIIALLSIAVLCFSFTACSGGASDSGETTTAATEAVAEVSADSVEVTDTTSSTAVSASTTTTAPGAVTTTTSKNGTTVKTGVTTTTVKRNTTTTKRTTAKTTTKKKITTTTKSSTKQYCYLTIECSKILDNMDNLAKGHEKYVPSDGYIIKNYKFTITGKETVYDVLKEACKDNKIKLTADNNTKYGIYVSGINNLDEKDCGKYSGWLYRVNGIAPAKSCGLYTVSNGDRITWSYTC